MFNGVLPALLWNKEPMKFRHNIHRILAQRSHLVSSTAAPPGRHSSISGIAHTVRTHKGPAKPSSERHRLCPSRYRSKELTRSHHDGVQKSTAFMEYKWRWRMPDKALGSMEAASRLHNTPRHLRARRPRRNGEGCGLPIGLRHFLELAALHLRATSSGEVSSKATECTSLGSAPMGSADITTAPQSC
ncbi:hypothetical protein H920_12898 [Fukomys damarensis]|uniref:Uncharacterized protein n=1 Tax=Fukomys damarensis TaxID=885580 RepID=A0A091D420_FUKDA|nr:hypothetical protein H920_12898 [Fukomys damarensis]